MKHTKNRLLLLFAFMTALLTGCNTNMKAPIELSWRHIGNDIEAGICHSELTIKNISSDTLKRDWTVYWNQMSVAPIATDSEQVHTTQIQASYHSLKPTSLFEPLPPDSSRTFLLRYRGSIMRRSGAPQGAFVYLPTRQTILRRQDQRKDVCSVKINYIYSGDGHEYRRKVAGFPYADGEEVYRQNIRFESRSGLTPNEIHLLPQPKQIEYTGGATDIRRAKVIHKTDNTIEDEGYELRITADTIYVIANSGGAGMWYAEQTLNTLRKRYIDGIPCCNIADWPDIGHRGLMLDIARNFTDKKEILKIIDLLSMYKMNVLHLHLTDDEGWRIEIPGLPELTEVGSRRGFTHDERDCLYPMYSGGWNPDDKNACGNGYLTRADYIEILRYAKQKHVRIVPEIDMPGHSRAAIKAMEARYYKYIDFDKEKAEEYLLSDFQDTSRYVSAQHYTDNVICIALPSCYRFCKKVIDEMMSMYKEADAPIEIFHVGGDEVPRGAWLGSPKVGEYVNSSRSAIERNGQTKESIVNSQIINSQIVNATDVANLKDSFLEAVAAMLEEYGVETAGWEEVAYRQGQPNPRFAGKNILTYAWNSVPEWRGDEKPYKLANAGYQVMICSVCNLYMDMCYLNHEEETGLNWGGYVDEYSSFDLRPDSLYLSVRRTMRGEIRDLGRYVKSGKTSLLPDSVKNLRGVQAELWSETIRNSKQLERYLLPKLLGTAERTWNNTWQGDYEEAIIRYNELLYSHELPALKQMSYSFHLPQPGIHREAAEADNGKTVVYMNCPARGAQIRYTTDGTEPTEHSLLYIGPFETESKLINARSFYLSEKSNTTHSCPQDKPTEESNEPIVQSTF